jgi:hypothetical protein
MMAPSQGIQFRAKCNIKLMEAINIPLIHIREMKKRIVKDQD